MSELIYHYTTAEGLIGILSDQQIYATESRFLNDRSEIIAGIELINNVANKKSLYKKTEYGHEINFHHHDFELDLEQDDEVRIALEQEFKSLVENVSSILKKKQIFISSFSTEEDSLIHWMTYAKSKIGYCIAFDKNELLSGNPSREYCDFQSVSYNKVEREEMISNEIEYYLLQYLDNNIHHLKILDETFDITGRIPNNLQKLYNHHSLSCDEILKYQLSYMAASIKNPEYDFEKEVRLISIKQDPNIEKQSVIHFSDNDVIKPIRKIGINKSSIKKIFIGPSIRDDNKYHEGKIISGVQSLIENNQYKNIEIIRSKKTLSK